MDAKDIESMVAKALGLLALRVCASGVKGAYPSELARHLGLNPFLPDDACFLRFLIGQLVASGCAVRRRARHAVIPHLVITEAGDRALEALLDDKIGHAALAEGQPGVQS